jgi:glycosyltransferase involved in cell wall biosynthesis
MQEKVIIDPAVNVYYASFYIKGLYELFGKENVIFNNTSFYDLKSRDVNFNFIIRKGSFQTKYSISVDDSFEIKKECYEWSDKYGCLNTNWEKTPPEFTSKLISLAPSFAIRLWGIRDTFKYAAFNYFNYKNTFNIRKFFGKYKRQYFNRLPLDYYSKVIPDHEYIFHVSSLWPSDEWINNDDFVNRKRAVFIEVCKSIPEISFDGGFYFNRTFTINERFKELLIKKYIPFNQYIEKTKKSLLVFNTPAWMNCHGWKLGEYLALGKAIISTPLYNDLPEPLIHEENVHFVTDEPEDIKEAILRIYKDKKYREKISEGAYQYYLRNGTPLRALELMGIKAES